MKYSSQEKQYCFSSETFMEVTITTSNVIYEPGPYENNHNFSSSVYLYSESIGGEKSVIGKLSSQSSKTFTISPGNYEFVFEIYREPSILIKPFSSIIVSVNRYWLDATIVGKCIDNYPAPDTATPPEQSPPIRLVASKCQNYIYSFTSTDGGSVNGYHKIDYHDGLGRLSETVLKKASPNQKDIVTLQEYDGAGRPSNSYIPTPASTGTGAYLSPDVVKTQSDSFYDDTHAFGKPVYEASLLNRVTEQYGPGSAWHTGRKRVVTAYLTNSPSGELSCGLYAVASDNSLQRKGFYAVGELYVTKTTGEDEEFSYTFTDKLGRVVLERAMNGTVSHDTYYVYDDFGNLRYTLPPTAAEALTATTVWPDDNVLLKNYAYIYKYDGRNRCIQKKLPGCTPILMKYDKADRLIFSQDGNQSLQGEWTFFFYDTFGRPAVTGICTLPMVPDVSGIVIKVILSGRELPQHDDGAMIKPPSETFIAMLGGYYLVNPIILTTVKLMTVNYYDDYRFIGMQTALADTTGLKCTTLSGYDNAFPNNTAPNAKGLLTGTRTYRLDDPSKYTVSALYYDHRERVVQSHTSNHLGGFEDAYFAYTFMGKVKQHQQVHSAPGKTTQTETYTYDYGTPQSNPTERLLSVSHKLNSAAQVILAQYTYDEVGRVKTKKLHGTAETQTYSYNVRGWVTRVAGDRFNQTLVYNEAVNGITPSTPLYGGNISAMKWTSGDETTERGYKFTYDNLNRLTDANYGEGPAITANANRFNEKSSYDKMGNIITLQRRGKVTSSTYDLIDDLTYTYNGNQLTKVSDAVITPITNEDTFHFVDGANTPNEYAYDANGNLIKDLNKNITSITYNALNLPSVITFGDGKTVTYVYDASGSKLSVTYNMGNGVISKMEYTGNKVYKNGTLGTILTEEGYVTMDGSTPKYHYFLKDHQGNNRVVIDQAGTVEQVNHYYPFGGLFGEGQQDSNQPYKYNGKEFDHLLGLNMYDYGARHYDAALGRWFTVDPLADHPKQVGISPYAFVANNPLRYIDPTGMIWKDPKQAERLNKSISNRIESIDKNSTKIQTQIDKGRLSDKKLAKLESRLAENSQKVEMLNQSLSDIEAIGNATETYKLTGPSSSDGTHGVVKGADGVIKIEGSNTGLHIHEIRHVGQSIEAGGVKFNKDEKLLNSATTLEGARNNEVNAYQTQYSFDGSYPAGASSLKDINGTTLMNIKTSDGRMVYEKLKDKKK